MSVQGPNSHFDFVGAYATSRRPAPSADTLAPTTIGGDSTAPASRVTLSPSSQALNTLQRLREDAPATFKAVIGHMADTVSAEADKSTGAQKQEFAKLSQKLGDAAKSGDLSVFHPTHHRHRAHAASQGVSTMLQTLLDQVDYVLGPDASSSNPER
jgi:hypothetical protein